jgi:hypothetical protein
LFLFRFLLWLTHNIWIFVFGLWLIKPAIQYLKTCFCSASLLSLADNIKRFVFVAFLIKYTFSLRKSTWFMSPSTSKLTWEN